MRAAIPAVTISMALVLSACGGGGGGSETGRLSLAVTDAPVDIIITVGVIAGYLHSTREWTTPAA